MKYIKENIDTTQKNSKCRLFDDKDKTVGHMKSEWGKLTKKELQNFK